MQYPCGALFVRVVANGGPDGTCVEASLSQDEADLMVAQVLAEQPEPGSPKAWPGRFPVSRRSAPKAWCG